MNEPEESRERRLTVFGERSCHVSAGVALGGDSVLRCQVGTSEAVEFFWHQGHDDFDMMFTPPALREFVRQANAALKAVDLFEALEDREQECGEFHITQGHEGRLGTIEELRKRLDALAASFSATAKTPRTPRQTERQS